MTLRKHIDAYKLLQLNEDEPGAPEGHAMGHGRKQDLVYVEKKVREVLDRVTLELSGSKAGVFTKLGRRYEQLEIVLERLQAKRNTMNLEMKSRMVELFDAEDEVLTRVIKTARLTLTLGKMETRTPKPNLNQKAFLDGVYTLADEVADLIPELTERIRALEEKHTTIGEPKEVSPKFSVKVPKESIEEDINVDEWEDIDMRLQGIKDRMEQMV